MMTPGPSSMDARVYRALATPLVGHLDPWFRGCMMKPRCLLRQIFQTENRITFPLSASGSGGIEASVLNSLESGDEAICWREWPVLATHARHCAAHTRDACTFVEAPYGRPVDPEDVRKVAKGRKIKMIGLAQGETSSGVVTNIDPFRQVADECGALLVCGRGGYPGWGAPEYDKQRVTFASAGRRKR